MKPQIHRQGDVLLRRVASLPKRAQPADVGRIKGRIVLAEGEATGHHHSVAVADAELLQGAEAIYLRVMTPTPLEHQEHAPITLNPGVWQVVRQREASLSERSRLVAD